MKSKTVESKPGRRLLGASLVLFLVVACGESPLASIGDRSAAWINEPEVTTTTRPQVELPTTVGIRELSWHNDGIVSGDLSDPTAVVAGVFGRREGDRFIQASRFEIAAALPELVFPGVAPYGATWISSQLVVENSGRLSSEPSVAFGFWSAVPYTRSRSVAQMAVLRVSNDPDTAAEVVRPGSEVTCARFAEQSTQECANLEVAGKKIWKLSAVSGTTLVWFEGDFRYELFGRPIVTSEVLVDMAADTMLLIELNTPVPLPEA